MSFAENLKLVRKERGITQEQLAEMLSVSRQAVSKWESGNGYPETDKLLVIAKELNVSLDYLLLEEAVVQEKSKTESKPVVYAPSGKIVISTFDHKNVVVCHAVKSADILLPRADEPKYILYGIDKVTFWGEHTTLLGWYASLKDVEQEITEITKAISEGNPSYELKYAANVKFAGFFQQPKLVKE